MVSALDTETRVEWTRPWLYDLQKAALFCEERFAITEASTKSGKTIGCIVWLTERAIEDGGIGRTFWWIAPVYGQARIAYRRMQVGSAAVPGLFIDWNNSTMTGTLFNGATVEFRSGEIPDNLYGENVFAAVLDEVTRMKEDVWNAVRTTLTATNGAARLIGNVKGKRNWAYRMARRAQMGELRGWHYSKITVADAIAAGVIKASEMRAAKEELPEKIYNELYEAEASDDGSNPFGLDHIAACMTPRLSHAEADVMAWDLGKRTDFTVGIGLDDSSAMCQYERFRLDWETVHIRIGESARGPRKVLLDSTGVGDPILERAQRAFGTHIEGYTWSAQSKQRLMEGLAVAIQREMIRIYDDPDGIIRGELESFEFEHTRTGMAYNAPEGFHDDVVAALAMAVMAQGAGAVRLYDIADANDPGGYRRSPLGSPVEQDEYEDAMRIGNVNRDGFGGPRDDPGHDPFAGGGWRWRG